jgi:hypothetical protein
LSRRPARRVSIQPRPGGVVVEISPLVRARSWRLRIVGIGAAVAVAALLGCSRLFQAWEAGLKRSDFTDLPLPVLITLTLAILVSTPLAFLGLAALAFGEESIEVDPREVVVKTTAFERTRVARIPREELTCWRETLRPLPPWWTWTVRRLAAEGGGRLYPVAGGAGPAEKRTIGEALAAATGVPLIGLRGKRIR